MNAPSTAPLKIAIIDDEPLAELDYISLADNETLEELSGSVVRPALLSMVVKFGKTRLLDNMELA